MSAIETHSTARAALLDASAHLANSAKQATSAADAALYAKAALDLANAATGLVLHGID